MSEYLKRKLLSQLREAKEVLSDPCEGVMETALEEGISHLKSTIRNMDIQVADEQPVEKPEAYIHYEGHDLADIAIDIYKSQQPEVEVEEVTETVEASTAKKHHYKAIARSLTGMRNGGDAGKMTQSTPNGNGDLGEDSSTTGNGGNQKNTTDNYAALTTSMTLEEYEEYIRDSWGLNEEVETVEEQVVEEEEGYTVIDVLKEELLELDNDSWQSVDKVMRVVAKEYDMTPKELHKLFKEEHNGMIPDDWLREQEVVEECGWFPLEEAMIHKTGNPYEVSLIWKGHTRRLKFFYPQLAAPSRADMQKAVDLFYPGGKLLAYYPCDEISGSAMVLIPPMTENYEITYEEDWVDMSDTDNEIYNMICESEGYPLEAPIVIGENLYEITVKDHQTGEHRVITFGEGAAWTKKEGKNEAGGLNEKGRKSYERENPGSDLKAPQPKGGPRKKSFCARMGGMKKKLTSKKTANDPDSRINKSLRAWNC